jgi:hypothetical protein
LRAERENLKIGGLMGKTIFLVGLALSGLGLLLWWKPDVFSWFGHLPGDVRVERENFRFFMPLTSMILVSLALNLILRILQKW